MKTVVQGGFLFGAAMLAGAAHTWGDAHWLFTTELLFLGVGMILSAFLQWRRDRRGGHV